MRFQFIVFVFLIIFALPSFANSTSIVPLDRVVAIVNDEVITQSDLDEQMSLVTHQLEHDHSAIPAHSKLEEQVLNRMIDQALELQQAKQVGITVDSASLNAAVEKVAKQNNLNLDQFRAALKQQGLNYDQFREQIRKQMIINKLEQEQVASNIIITQQEVNNALKTKTNEKIKQFHLASIFIALPQPPSPEELSAAEQKINGIMSELKSGASFDQLAMVESNAPNALKGGDMGWSEPAQLPEGLANKLNTLKAGALLGPLRTSNGYLVLKLVGVREADNRQIMTQTEARHILLKTNALFSDVDAKAELLKLRKEIENGASFATLAKKYSQDPGSALKGGDLGWVDPGDLVPPFENAMNDLKPGQLSQPVQTQYGWHLIQVMARRQKDVTAQAQENQVRNAIFQRKFQEALQNWTSQMRAMAYVKILLHPAAKTPAATAATAVAKTPVTKTSDKKPATPAP